MHGTILSEPSRKHLYHCIGGVEMLPFDFAHDSS